MHEDGNSYGEGEIGASDQGASDLHRNGSVRSNESDGDADGDDSLDDELMDKISSSPSIEDGGSYSPFPRPDSGASLVMHPALDSDPESPNEDVPSSSPFAEPPAHFPLCFPQKELDKQPSKDHHQEGKYTMDNSGPDSGGEDHQNEGRGHLRTLSTMVSQFHEETDNLEDSLDDDVDPNDFYRLLLPTDDSLLESSFDDPPKSAPSPVLSSGASKSSWPIEKRSPNDDETNDISFLDDTRFIDSGWGGECLRETEDIDFEFVYALHTFVATVEGQANAAKGDTMVLLDDSNSYWWLVRIVKDSSIGGQHFLCRMARTDITQAIYLQSTLRHLQSDWQG